MDFFDSYLWASICGFICGALGVELWYQNAIKQSSKKRKK